MNKVGLVCLSVVFMWTEYLALDLFKYQIGLRALDARTEKVIEQFQAPRQLFPPNTKMEHL